MNAYQLGTDWSVNAGCGAQVDLDGYFGDAAATHAEPGRRLFSMAVNKKTGQLDFSAAGRGFRRGRPGTGNCWSAVLSGHDGSLRERARQELRWYAGGWRDTDTSHGQPMPFATNGWTPLSAGGRIAGGGRLDHRRRARAVQLRVDGLRLASP